MDLIRLEAKSLRLRFILAASVVLGIIFLWFAVSRQMGSAIAQLTASASPAAAEAADLAISLAPGDPVGRWLKASVALNSPIPNRGDAVVTSLEDAVRLSPADYRWRVELGRAYEQNDKLAAAELEFHRAVDLAPTYAFSHWHLGNFFLRQDRANEAFAELRRAAENNHTYREQVFSIAWDYFDKDPAKVEALASRDPDSFARLALFFAARGQADDSLRIWNQLSDADKSTFPEVGKNIAQGLFVKRFFPQALEFSRQLGLDTESFPVTVTNGGFERGVGAQDESRFDWRINRNDPKVDVSTDNVVKHDGRRSVRFSFRNFAKQDFYNLFQTIVVEPQANYRLSFWVRTENLKSSAIPFIQVINANDDRSIAASRSFQPGTTDWQEYTVDVRTPENCNGITIRTARFPCDQCTIVGTFWYDDFELRRL